MNLVESISELRKKVDEYTYKPIMNIINDEIIKEIEESEIDYIIKMKKELSCKIEKLKLDHSSDWEQFYNDYCEVKAFISLKDKINISRYVTESKSEQSPDFQIQYEKKDYCLEVKSLLYFDPKKLFKGSDQRGLETKCDMEKQIKDGKRVAVGIFCNDPFDFNNIIEFESIVYRLKKMINKIKDLIKIGQFDKGKTILYLDLSLFTFFDSNPYCKNLLPCYISNNKILSGFLWNLTFAKKGSYIFKNIKFNGQSNFDDFLSISGLFDLFDYIKGIVFCLKTVNNKNIFLGTCRSNDKDIIELLEKICCAVNTENSENCYPISCMEKSNCNKNCNGINSMLNSE